MYCEPCMAVGYNQRILQITKLQGSKTVQCVSLGVPEWKEGQIMINGFPNSVCECLGFQEFSPKMDA